MDSARILKNLIRKYGDEKARWFLLQLQEGASGEGIAQNMGVSRERVRQWKKAFGQETRSYDLFPEVEALLS